MARPCLLNATRQRAILKALGVGCTKKVAAEIAGVSYDALNGWERQGKKDEAAEKDTKFSKFSLAIKKTLGKAIEFRLGCLKKEAKAGKWQAAAWLLERLDPETYGKAPDTIVSATAIAGAVAGAGALSPELVQELQSLDGLSDTELRALAGGVPKPKKVIATRTPNPKKRTRRTNKQLKAQARKLLKSGTPKARLYLDLKVQKSTASKILKEI